MELEKIIETTIEQESDLIGPVAIRKASNVDGVEIDDDGNVTSLEGDGEEVLTSIFDAYEDVVGEKAIELLKRKVRDNIDSEVPEVLE